MTCKQYSPLAESLFRKRERKVTMKEDSIYVIDENGKEIEMKIYLTFDANDKKYVVVYKEGDDDNLYSFVYDDNGNLYTVDEEEELSMVEEVVSAYEEEN